MKLINGTMVFTLKEAAQITNVPETTLLFWERKGLLHIWKNSQNGYRYFNYEDFYEIQRISFFRRLGLSIEQLQQFPLDAEQLKALSENQIEKINEQIRMLEEAKEECCIVSQRLNVLKGLARKEYEFCSPPFDKLYPIGIQNARNSRKIFNYVRQSYEVLDIEGNSETFLAVSDELVADTAESIWEKKEGGRYVRCLLTLPFFDSVEYNENIDQCVEIDRGIVNDRLNMLMSAGFHVSKVILEYVDTLENNGIKQKHYILYAEV